MEHISDDAIASYGAGVLGLGVLVLVIIFAIRGRVRIEPGRANKTVPRWTPFERVLHWYVAILFILLALTGLGLVYGRKTLIPVLDQEAFTAWADLAVSIHNLLGPAFAAGVLVMIVRWMGDNIPARYDWEFFKQGGGIVTGKYPSAGKVNAGDKLFVYWLGLVVVGTIVCVTGLILEFADYGQSAETMQLSSTLHLIGALAWTFIILGHAYLRSLGVEGSFETMTCGRVDVNFAKQHHDMWAEELMQMGVTPQSSQTLEESTDDM
jgi:formate dehydrogenase subunit gamma